MENTLNKEKYSLPRLAKFLRDPFNRRLKTFLQDAIVFPLFRIFVKIDHESEVDLTKLTPPLVFMGNHPNPPQDVLYFLSVLPRKVRNSLVMPGNDWVWTHGLLTLPFAWISVLIAGEFPINVYGGSVGKSLETIADFLDDGFNIMVMPEGDTTPIGMTLGDLKSGMGEVLAGTNTNIVPFFVSGEIFKTFPRQKDPMETFTHFIPRGFSTVKIKIGKPFTVETDSAGGAMVKIQKNILALSK